MTNQKIQIQQILRDNKNWGNFMQVKLYNTLTKTKEEFKPIDNKEVKIYTCGPTVYSYAHIGNFRAYIFMDNIRRVLKYNGYDLKHVMNITDVGHLESDADEGEDKMEKAARKENKNPYEIAKYYESMFFRDIERHQENLPQHRNEEEKAQEGRAGREEAQSSDHGRGRCSRSAV